MRPPAPKSRRTRRDRAGSEAPARAHVPQGAADASGPGWVMGAGAVARRAWLAGVSGAGLCQGHRRGRPRRRTDASGPDWVRSAGACAAPQGVADASEPGCFTGAGAFLRPAGRKDASGPARSGRRRGARPVKRADGVGAGLCRGRRLVCSSHRYGGRVGAGMVRGLRRVRPVGCVTPTRRGRPGSGASARAGGRVRAGLGKDTGVSALPQGSADVSGTGWDRGACASARPQCAADTSGPC